MTLIMIFFRYRYRPVTVFSPVTVRYRFWTNVTQGCPALRTVPQRYPTLQALLSVTERYQALPSVTERYLALPHLCYVL